MLRVLRQMYGDTNTEGSSPLTELGPGFPNAVWKEIDILTTMEKELYRNKSTSNKNSNNKQSMLVWRGEVGKVSWNPFLWCPRFMHRWMDSFVPCVVSGLKWQEYQKIQVYSWGQESALPMLMPLIFQVGATDRSAKSPRAQTIIRWMASAKKQRKESSLQGRDPSVHMRRAG